MHYVDAVQTKTAGASPYRLWEFLLPGISRPASKAQPTGLVFVAYCRQFRQQQQPEHSCRLQL